MRDTTKHLLTLCACAVCFGLVGWLAGHFYAKQYDGITTLPPASSRLQVASIAAAPIGAVVLYTRPGCDDSQNARAWLEANGYYLDERDIDRSPDALREVRALGAKRTPLIVSAGRQIEGFDPEMLASVLPRPSQG